MLRNPLSLHYAWSYIAAATIACLAAVLVVAKVGGFDLTGSSTYLLPALAASSLGTAIVTPGQFSPTGKFLGIYFLEMAIAGGSCSAARGCMTPSTNTDRNRGHRPAWPPPHERRPTTT